MPDKIKTPKVVNIADLRPGKNRNVLVHCTDAQFKRMIKGAVEVRTLPEGAFGANAMPLQQGGFIVSFPCPTGCSYDLVFRNGRFVRECVCVDGPPPPHIEACKLGLGTPTAPRFGCLKEGCPGTCVLGIKLEGPFIRLACICK